MAEFFSTKEVAERYGVTTRAIQKLIKAGDIPAIRVGNLFRIPADKLAEYEANGGSTERQRG